MNINDQITKLQEYQNLTGGYTEVALENIKMSPFLLIDYIEKVDFLINEDEIRIYLVRKKSLASWFQKTFQKRIIEKNLILLSKYIYFWVPKTKNMPKINFYWGSISDVDK